MADDSFQQRLTELEVRLTFIDDTVNALASADAEHIGTHRHPGANHSRFAQRVVDDAHLARPRSAQRTTAAALLMAALFT